jgi:hypothetical protein
MKQIFLGHFQLGWENVDLYVLPEEDGGVYFFCPDAKSLGRIKVGLDYDYWNQVLTVLFHEGLEYLLEKYGYCFNRAGNICRDLGAKWFHFNHVEYSEICSRLGVFIAEAAPKVEKEWKKRHAKQR